MVQHGTTYIKTISIQVEFQWNSSEMGPGMRGIWYKDVPYPSIEIPMM